MSKLLYINRGTIKHVNGNSYPATNVITVKDLNIITLGITVPDNELNTIYSTISAGNDNIIDSNGLLTNKYYAIKNLAPSFYDIFIYAAWSNVPDLSAKYLSIFNNYSNITTFAPGASNNALIVKNEYELYCDVPNKTVIKGTYKNGTLLNGFYRYSGFSGYLSRFPIYIYNESLTYFCGVTIVPSENDQSVRVGSSTLVSEVPTVIKNMLLEITVQGDIPSDPFAPGGINNTGGGDGTFNPNSEDITDPEVPDVDAVSTGFITLFNPSVSELNNLASYMWSGGFDINTFKKLFANPMDCILGLSILPKIVPNGGRGNVLVGNIDTGVSMTKAARQYIKFDCGSINIARYSNSFLDYSPYTKIYLYLPFIGIHEISTDDVMNKTLQVKYSIDILSGACVAFVIAGGTTLYSYIGQCAASVPVTSQDWSTMINGVLSAVGSIASTVGSIASGNVGSAISGAASTAQSVLGSKPSIQHGGSMGGMGGMLGIKTPFVIIERPAQAIPAEQNTYTGYPSFVTKNFEDLTGYNEIYSTHLHDIPCTENELKEIESLLKNGVIF